MVTADDAGNVVSMTATQGGLYGSTVVIDGLGLVMGHGMSRFDLAAGSPNAPAAGKRMFHNMAPTLVLGPDGLRSAAVGLARRPQDRDGHGAARGEPARLSARTPAVVISAGRIHVEDGEPLAVSAAVPDAVIDELRAMGHTVRRGQDTGGPPREIGGAGERCCVIDPRIGQGPWRRRQARRRRPRSDG